MLTGVTSETKQNIQLGAGVLCSGFVSATKVISGIIGASRGGGSFTAVPTTRQIPVDGMPTHTVGMEVIDDWIATLNVTLLDTTETAIKLALGAADVTSGVIKARHEIKEEDYEDVYWVGNKAGGGFLAIKLLNARNKSGFNFTIVDKGEGTFSLALIANYSIPTTGEFIVPFEIINVEA